MTTINEPQGSRPIVEVKGSDPGDMRAEVTMNAAAFDTNDSAEVDTRPARPCTKSPADTASMCGRTGVVVQHGKRCCERTLSGKWRTDNGKKTFTMRTVRKEAE